MSEEPKQEWQVGLGEYQENELTVGPDGHLTRRKFIALGGMAAGAAAAGPLIFTTTADAAFAEKSNLPYHANTSVKGHIQFWHHWASPQRRTAIRVAIAQFEKIYKGVKVSDTAWPFGQNWTKTTAIVAAGGAGAPDVEVSNRPTLWSEGKHRIYQSLNTYAARDHVNGAKIFWPFTWYEAAPKQGKKQVIYGLPFETDIRVLWINRAMLMNNGMNPNQTPKTWGDLASYADKLDVKDKIMAINILDLDLSSWPWTNNTDFQNSKMYPELNTAKMVETANWMKGWVDRYGGIPSINANYKANVSPGRDLFMSQIAAMTISTPIEQGNMLFYGVKFIPTSGPNAGKNIYPFWKAGLVPYNAAGGGKPRTFSGGFSLSMPTNPHRSKATTAAAWEFIKYMALVGQATFERSAGLLPTVKSMAKDPIMSSEPNWDTYMKAFAYGHAADRNIYDVNFPGDVIGPAQTAILQNGTPAQQALDTAQNQALQNMKLNGGP